MATIAHGHQDQRRRRARAQNVRTPFGTRERGFGAWRRYPGRAGRPVHSRGRLLGRGLTRNFSTCVVVIAQVQKRIARLAGHRAKRSASCTKDAGKPDEGTGGMEREYCPPVNEIRTKWPPRRRRILLVAGTLVLSVGAILLPVATRVTPHVRDRTVASLEDRFRSDVDLASLQVSVLPRPEVVALSHGRRSPPSTTRYTGV